MTSPMGFLYRFHRGLLQATWPQDLNAWSTAHVPALSIMTGDELRFVARVLDEGRAKMVIDEKENEG